MKIFFYFLLLSTFGFSQNNVSGIWIAKKNKNPLYSMLYIEQDLNGKLKGVSYDETSETEYCNFEIEGYYDKTRDFVDLNSTRGLAKTKTHNGGNYRLVYKQREQKETLEGDFSFEAPVSFKIGKLKVYGSSEKIKLIFERFTEQNIDSIYQAKFIKPHIKKNLVDANEGKTDSIKTEPETESNLTEQEKFNQIKNSRTNELIEIIHSKSTELILKMKDYGQEDGDRISVYLDEEIIFFDKPVSTKTEIFNITLPIDKKEHKLYFVANNLGDIPPNTTQIQIIIDNQKINKILHTDEQKNGYFLIKPQ
jgi:hypothetical protein